jgi:hypothetical protein
LEYGVEKRYRKTRGKIGTIGDIKSMTRQEL